MNTKRIHGKRKRITVSNLNHLRVYTSVNAQYNAIEQPKLEVQNVSEFLEQFEFGKIKSGGMVLPQRVAVTIQTALTENK